ncbi:MAG: hypothetical protein Q8P72_00135 [Candidatus Roizmanbacteria bacterium]|nr:hypothetical protein [Candidatus Roizmanbacteria bacterium]
MLRLFNILVLATIFFLNFLPVKDPDFGWHYRCGYELLQGHPCLSNTFTYFLADYQAFYPSFIYDALTAIVFNSVGFIGLSVVHALMMTGAFYLFYKLSKQNILFAGVLFLTVTFLSGGTLGLGWRPQIVTFFLILLGVWILQNKKGFKIQGIHFQPIYFYPLLMLVWVNTHIGFFTGLVIFGTYWIQDLVKFLRKKIKIQTMFTVTAIVLSSFLATLINPFGYKVYIEIFNHLKSPLNTMIAEWVAPPPLYILIILISLISIPVIQTMQKKLSVFEMLTLLFFGITALMARRNVPLFLTFAGIQYLQLIPKKKFSDIFPLLLPFIGAVLLSVTFINIQKTVRFHTDWNIYCTKGATNYPCKAIQNYPKLSGNVYGAYEWGGFLIWQRPDIKIFVDGRMPAWFDEDGESPYNVYLKILQTQEGWNEKLRKYDTDYLLLAQGTFLDLLLDEEAQTYGWEKVYEDKTHAIYKNLLTY